MKQLNAAVGLFSHASKEIGEISFFNIMMKLHHQSIAMQASSFYLYCLLIDFTKIQNNNSLPDTFFILKKYFF